MADSTKLDTFRANSGFLADINNERVDKNQSYATRLSRLAHFVLVYSTSDQIIQPAISSWFGFYKDDSTDVLEPLASRKMYKEDWIGLRELDTTGRLHFAKVHGCQHTEVSDEGVVMPLRFVMQLLCWRTPPRCVSCMLHSLSPQRRLHLPL